MLTPPTTNSMTTEWSAGCGCFCRPNRPKPLLNSPLREAVAWCSPGMVCLWRTRPASASLLSCHVTHITTGVSDCPVNMQDAKCTFKPKEQCQEVAFTVSTGLLRRSDVKGMFLALNTPVKSSHGFYCNDSCRSAQSIKVLTCHMPQQWQLLCFTASFLVGLTPLLHPILYSSLQGSSAPHLHQHLLTCLL